ncbi:MAG: hypothetical protein R2757_13480 [Draconibacterium sp.]
MPGKRNFGYTYSPARKAETGRKNHQQAIYKDVPSGKEICEKQLFSLIDKVEKIEVNDTQISGYAGNL